MHKFWLSLMARPGDLIQRRSPAKSAHRLVVAVSPYGALCLRAEVVQITSAHVVVRLVGSGGADDPIYEQVCIDDAEQWYVAEVVARPPQWFEEHNIPRGPFQNQVAFVIPLSEPVSLVKAAAYRGFLGMTVSQLQDLADHFKIPRGSRRAIVEFEVVSLCVKHFLPEISPEDLLEIVAQRHPGAKKSGIESVLSDEAAVAACEELGPDDELCGSVQAEAKAMQLAKKVDKAALKHLKPMALKRSSAASSSAAASSSSARAPVALPAASPLERRKYELSEVRAMLPQSVKGCTITKHSGKAWLVRYPSGEKQSLTVGFEPGNVESIAQALEVVLRWVWTKHLAMPGHAGQMPPVPLDM